MNSTLDIQWQPRNDLAIDIGYVNALGRHEVIPIPFNQARIATPTNPLCGPAAVCPTRRAHRLPQSYTYGYTVQTCASRAWVNFEPLPGQFAKWAADAGQLPKAATSTCASHTSGMRAESESYIAEGISAYNALQAHVEKRLSHGLQVGVSYTFSRSLDEQSALGLFYNGNNPLNMRNGYGPSDFDRTHVFNIDYHYELPKFFRDLYLGRQSRRRMGHSRSCRHPERTTIQRG